MTEYVIKKIGDLDLSLDSDVWLKANPAKVTTENWQATSYVPDTTARILYNDHGIFVRFETDEEELLIRKTKFNDEVYLDSCVEFFLNPNPEQTSYFNFEINAGGTPLIGFGPDKKTRSRLNLEDLSIFRIQNQILDRGFILSFFIPFDFLKGYAKDVKKHFLGNLQKCCEDSKTPHFLSYYKIDTPEPFFHSPEFFGGFCFE